MFQSAPPARGAIAVLNAQAQYFKFQSAPPARGAIAVTVTGYIERAKRASFADYHNLKAWRPHSDDGTPPTIDPTGRELR